MPYKKVSNIREFNKISQVKQEIYRLTLVDSTKQLKKTYPELTKKKDLRKKENWINLYNTLKLINNFQQNQISKQLAQEFGFISLNKNSNFQDLLINLQSLRKFIGTLESKFRQLI